jgi:hypothetical protein
MVSFLFKCCSAKLERMILCDTCDAPYHPQCVGLMSQEEVDKLEVWYCSKCFNDPSQKRKKRAKAKASEKKETKSKGEIALEEGRKWGGGMSCSGRTKECTIVPINVRVIYNFTTQ